MGRIIPFVARVGAPGDFSAEDRARLAELAERYAAAGVCVEVIYGATEDGDPWCVVKDENEDVLIHVARIGDSFVVHYAVDDALRQGKDLRSVLRERLAWEDRPEVVVPFSRQAQNLLALIVAASFFHETVKPGDEAQAPWFEPLDGHAGHAAATAAAALPGADTTLASKAIHAGALSLATLDSGPADTAHSPAWRDVADDAPLRFDHAGVEVVRFSPNGPTAPIANLEVGVSRAPDGPTPIVMAFDARPHLAAANTDASPTAAVGPSTTATFRKTDEDPPAPQKPPAPDHALVASHWVEVDTDGDGRPDTRIEVPGSPKVEKPELAAADHTAILAVGHGFLHHEIV